MKTISFFFFITISTIILAQTPKLEITSDASLDDFFKMYETLNPEKIPTGILYDKVLHFSNFENYTGKDSTSVSNYNEWNQILFEIEKATVRKSIINNRKQILEITRLYKTKNITPILLMNIKYNSIKPDAIDKGLLKLENDNLYDISGNNQSLYDEKRVFTASIPVVNLNYPNNTFILSDDFFCTNDSLKIEYYEIDFDDGNGFNTYYKEQNIDIIFKNPGNKIIRIKAFLDNKTILYASTETKTLNQEVPDYDIQETITATIPYDGWYDTENVNDMDGNKGKAIVSIWFAPGNEVLTKPFIVLDGFDPFTDEEGTTQSRHFEKLYTDFNQVHTLDILQQCYGYDIVIVDWMGGADWIQKNAMCLVEILDWINEIKVGFNKNIVLGPSMGGMIGRYALAYMESNNLEHDVGVFIPADSPLNGANIPLGMQFWVNEIQEKEELAKVFVNTLNSPAAKQLLVYQYAASMKTLNIEPTHDPMRDVIEEEYIEYGDYPIKPTLIGVANGSAYGHSQNNTQNQEMEPSSLLMHVDLITTQWGIEGKLLVDAYALPDEDKETILTMRFKGVRILKVKVKGTKPYDCAPGGFFPGLAELQGNPGITLFHPYINFIPTVSALDVETDDLYHTPITLDQTPFDYIYYPPGIPSADFTPSYQPTYPYSYNEKHSMITGEKRDFFLDIIGYNLPIDLFIQNETLFNPTVNELIEIKSTNSITAGSNVDPNQTQGIVKIKSGNNVNFVAGTEINLEPGFEAEGNFETFIEETEPVCDFSCKYPPQITQINGTSSVYTVGQIKLYATLDYPIDCIYRYVYYEWHMTTPDNSQVTLPFHTPFIETHAGGPGDYIFYAQAFNDFGGGNIASKTVKVEDLPFPKSPTSKLDTNKTILTDIESSIKCYPNPNNGTFTIFNSSETQSENIVKIYNTLGAEVYNSTFETSTSVVDISMFPKGIYIVRIYSDNGIYSEKIIYQ